MFRSESLRAFVVGIVLYSMVFAQSRPLTAQEPSWKVKLSGFANDAWVVTKDNASGAWEYSKEKTHTAFKVAVDEATPLAVAAKEKVLAGAQVSWVWTKAGANDAWEWVKEQTPTAKDWIADTADGAWLITREKSGQLYLWVKVKADESGATSYVRTTLDETWTWTTDNAGRTWVWIKDHKVEIGVFAAFVAGLVYAYFTKNSAPPASLSQHYAATNRQFPHAVTHDQFGDIAFRTFESRANASNYRNTFVHALGKPLPNNFEVHHSLPQKYENLVSGAGINIHNPYRLQGVDRATHTSITRDWANWDRNLGHSPTAADVTSFKQTIDQKYAGKLIELER